MCGRVSVVPGAFGEWRDLQWLPAPAEGQRCTLGFFRDAERRKACERALGRSGLCFMLNGVSLFAAASGEFAEALLFRRDANAIARQLDEHENLDMGLRKRGTASIPSWPTREIGIGRARCSRRGSCN